MIQSPTELFGPRNPKFCKSDAVWLSTSMMKAVIDEQITSGRNPGAIPRLAGDPPNVRKFKVKTKVELLELRGDKIRASINAKMMQWRKDVLRRMGPDKFTSKMFASTSQAKQKTAISNLRAMIDLGMVKSLGRVGKATIYQRVEK